MNDESPATASLRSATPKKNVSCFSDFARDRFFLKMERTFFFGVPPSMLRAVWRGFNADSVLPKLFSGEKELAKPWLIFVFAFCPRGGGVWGGIRAGFWISFFAEWATGKIPQKKINCLYG